MHQLLRNCTNCGSLESLLNYIECTLAEMSINRWNILSYATEGCFDDVLFKDLLKYKRIISNRLTNPDYPCSSIDVQDIIAKASFLVSFDDCSRCPDCFPEISTTTTTTSTSTTTSTTTAPQTIVSFTFNLTQADSMAIALNSGSKTIWVNWGNGQIGTGSGDIGYVTIYSSPYSGQVTISTYDNFDDITEFTFGAPVTGSGSCITNELAKLTALQQFTSSSDNFYVNGNVNQLPDSLELITIDGGTNMFGDVANIPTSATKFYVHGDNTLEGDLASMPSSLDNVSIKGDNTITGDVADMPSGMVQFGLEGLNTIFGDVANMPDTLTNVGVKGFNTISGGLGDLPPSVVNFEVYGENTISGSIGDIPSTVIDLGIGGNNTVNGALSSLPSTMTAFAVLGDNTVEGSISDLPSGIYYLVITGDNTVDSYTGGRTWASPMDTVNILCESGSGLDQTEVDNLLVDLSATTWGANRYIRLLGDDMASPSLTGQTAALNLASPPNDCDILTN